MTRHFMIRAALLAAVAISALAFVPRFAGGVLTGADDHASAREIHLVAREMTFYIDGEEAPNPTLHARPGERLRIVLRNTDVGMLHDFVIRSWSVNTRLLKANGVDRIEFSVPQTRGAHAYSCTPHAGMMGGTILVN